MTYRYNPQSIEKQVRKWPVFFWEKDLHKDIIIRLNQIYGVIKNDWASPYSVELPFDEEIIYEYGVDACRISVINSGYSKSSETLLEASYKWIAKLNDCFTKNIANKFNPVPWLEALIQMYDHIITRESDRLALALVMKALKVSPPSNEITEQEKMLVAFCLFPFIPIYTSLKIIEPSKFWNYKDLIGSFREYFCVRIALENGGWHWQVISYENYNKDPISELLKIKWIKKAIKGKKLLIKEQDGGIKICFV